MAKRVLLVDDNEGIRAVLRMSFELTGDFEVVGNAENGAEAIEQLQEGAPEVVVLDIAMPVMDGLQALPEIRRLAPNAKIIMYTAAYDPSTRDTALSLGADAYIDKASIPTDVVKTAAEMTASD